MRAEIQVIAILLSLGTVVLAGTGVARAQGFNFETTRDGRFSLGLGAFRPDDHAVRDATGEGWALLTVKYRVMPGAPRLLDTSAFLDIASGSTRKRTRYRDEFFEFSREFYGAGLATNLNLIPPQRGNKGFSLHLTAGAGGYYLGRESAYIYPGTDPYGYPDPDNQERQVLNHHGRVNFGYRLGGGVRFGRGFYAEVMRFNLGRMEGARYDGTSLAIGAQF